MSWVATPMGAPYFTSFSPFATFLNANLWPTSTRVLSVTVWPITVSVVPEAMSDLATATLSPGARISTRVSVFAVVPVMVVFRQKSNVSTAKDAKDAKERQELKQGRNVKNARACVLAAGERYRSTHSVCLWFSLASLASLAVNAFFLSLFSQFRYPPCDILAFQYRCLQLGAQPRPFGRGDIAVLHRRQLGDQIAVPVIVERPHHFLYQRIRAVQRQVHRSGKQDRPGAVVRSDRQRVGFRHGRDLLRLGQAPGPAHVQHAHRDGLFLEQFAEAPARAQGLGGGDPDVGAMR